MGAGADVREIHPDDVGEFPTDSDGGCVKIWHSDANAARYVR
jgi:hypothetical protein